MVVPNEEPSKHDPYFKTGMKIPKISVPFLKHSLPKELTKDMDLSQLKLESETLVSETLGRKVVDVLFSVPYKGETAFIYVLVEHQSTVDAWMPFRLVFYVFSIWDQLIRGVQDPEEQDGDKSKKRNTRSPQEKLPPIFPMVYYNGELAYTSPLKLTELFEEPELLKRMLLEPMHLVDVGEVDDKAIKHETWLMVFHTLMKYVRKEDISAVLLDLIPQMVQIEKQSGGVAFLVSSFRYLLTSARKLNKQVIHIIVDQLKEAGGEMVTVAEQLRQEGRDEMALRLQRAERRTEQEAKAKRKAERKAEQEAEAKRKAEQDAADAKRKALASAQALLENGIDIETVVLCLGLPRDQVEAISP